MKGIKNIPCGRKGPIVGILIAALNLSTSEKDMEKSVRKLITSWNYLHIPKHYSFNFVIIRFFVKIISIPQITLFPLRRRASYLTIIFRCFHFENVRDYAVNGNISNETCEKQFLGDARAHQPKCWQAN